MTAEQAKQGAVGADNPPELVPGPTGTASQGESPVQEARKRKLEDIPPRQRSIFLRAWTGKSRKAAMRAFCLECFGYESAEVDRCTSPTCPLYEYRGDRL